MRLLLIEDEYILGSSLKRAIEKEAYGVDWYQDGRLGFEAAKTLTFDALILDINLPGLNGLDILRGLRLRGNSVPVLLLTALDALRQKVDGLDAGADDYLIKPFELDELFARLRALFRRREGRTENILTCGDVVIDPIARVIRRDGKHIQATAKEFQLLIFLMERAGRYVTRNDIDYALYDGGKSIESNAIEVVIYHLRKKLGADLIKSIRGVGYMIER
jgi:DNA-binding response OmpR family regulator